jgi:4-carboxymuconolactone decarboxylase
LSEIITHLAFWTHLAFYAGWPNAFSAVPIVKDVFDKRRR